MTSEWKKALEKGLIKKSTKKNKKLMVSYNDRIIHFGSSDYEHYHDETGIWKDLDHLEYNRLYNYITRHSNIKKKNGEKAILDPKSPAYWSLWILWNPKYLEEPIDSRE